MFGLGVQELLIILVILVFIFGTSRIADLGKGMGEGIRNFNADAKKLVEFAKKLLAKAA